MADIYGTTTWHLDGAICALVLHESSRTNLE